MVVESATSLVIEFVSTNLGGAVTDRVLFSKIVSCNFGDFCKPMPSQAPQGRVDNRSVVAGEAVAAAWRARNAATTPSGQRAALVELFNATGGQHWIYNDNWLSESDPCDVNRPWYGVSCTRVTERTLPDLWKQGSGGRGVTALSLASNNLRGSIPSNLGPGLSKTIQYIDMSANRIEGELPASLFIDLPVLHTLYVEPATDNDLRYKLTGQFPKDMGLRVPNLRYLGVTRNQLNGSLPPSWGDLPCHVNHASGAAPGAGGILPADPSVQGEVACAFWVLQNNFTGSISHNWCKRSFNELYIEYQGRPDQPFDASTIACERPCVSVAYAHWPVCSTGSTGVCTPC
jgi:hypothetical protein